MALMPPTPSGTASCCMWTLRATGRLFHSGLPHKGINSVEFGMDAIKYIQDKFYKEFPPVSAGLEMVLQNFCNNS